MSSSVLHSSVAPLTAARAVLASKLPQDGRAQIDAPRLPIGPASAAAMQRPAWPDEDVGAPR